MVIPRLPYNATKSCGQPGKVFERLGKTYPTCPPENASTPGRTFLAPTSKHLAVPKPLHFSPRANLSFVILNTLFGITRRNTFSRRCTLPIRNGVVVVPNKGKNKTKHVFMI